MKTFGFVWVIILVATLAVAAEKSKPESKWQWQAEELADFGQSTVVNAIAAGPDGSVVAATCGKTDSAVGKLLLIRPDGIKPFEAPPGGNSPRFRDLVVSSDAKVLYGVETFTGAVFIWNLADQFLASPKALQQDTRELALVTFKDATSAATMDPSLLAFNSFSQDTLRKGTVRIRSGAQGVDRKFELTGEITDLRFAPTASPQDSYLAALVWEHKQSSGGNYGPYWIFLVGPRAPGLPWEPLARHKIPSAPFEVAISPVDQAKIAVGTAKGLVLMDRNTGKILAQPSPREDTIKVVFLPDGTLVSGGLDGIVRVWDITKTRSIAQLGKKGSPVTALAAGSAESAEILVAVNGRVHRYKRQSLSDPVVLTK